MRSGGYVKTYRQIREWQFWDRPLYTQVWMHLLVEANWKEKAYKYGQELKAGETIITLRGFAEECGINKDTLHRILCDLQSAGQIETSVRQGKTFIKVLNYAKFQSTEGTTCDTESDNHSDTESDTQSDKSETSPYLFNRRNKEKKKGRIVMANPTLDTIREYIYTENLMVDPDRFFDYYESQGWKLSNGNKMKDWKASCRNWHRKEVEKMNKEKKGGLPF